MEDSSEDEVDENQEPPNKKLCTENELPPKKGKLSTKGKKNVRVT